MKVSVLMSKLKEIANHNGDLNVRIDLPDDDYENFRFDVRNIVSVEKGKKCIWIKAR